MILVRRFAFRLLFSYWAVYLILNWLVQHIALQVDVGIAPGLRPLVTAHTATWARVVVWAGQHVLRVPGRLRYYSGGNSDGLFSFVQLPCFALIAVLSAVVWTTLDRQPSREDRIRALLHTCLRYVLATTLLGYGMIKVIPAQFHGLPSLDHLVQPYAEFTPFEVLWNFMGSSPAYTIFTGAIEVSAALLLLFQRTTTLGALVAAGALANIGALDFAYGVPEKLDVIHLFAMAMILVARDLSRLAGVLVFNRAVSPIAYVPGRGSRSWIGRTTVKIAIVAYLLVTSTLLPFRLRASYPPHGPLYGIYDVVTFDANGRTLEPLTTDPVRWRRVVFDSAEDAWVEMMDNSWRYYSTEYDARSARVTLAAETGRSGGAFHYERTADGHLALRGALGDTAVGFSLAHVDESQFPLIASRFRWINGQP